MYPAAFVIRLCRITGRSRTLGNVHWFWGIPHLRCRQALRYLQVGVARHKLPPGAEGLEVFFLCLCLCDSQGARGLEAPTCCRAGFFPDWLSRKALEFLCICLCFCRIRVAPSVALGGGKAAQH
mmetsp:Transcript_12710/g.31586  ORF Transcript_12710/g.31586 Transcript_12710/m.31586 type:complete len:124 (-) Transcript_12710:137-508(-)